MECSSLRGWSCNDWCAPSRATVLCNSFSWLAPEPRVFPVGAQPVPVSLTSVTDQELHRRGSGAPTQRNRARPHAAVTVPLAASPCWGLSLGLLLCHAMVPAISPKPALPIPTTALPALGLGFPIALRPGPPLEWSRRSLQAVSILTSKHGLSGGSMVKGMCGDGLPRRIQYPSIGMCD